MWAKVDDGWWCHPKTMGTSLAARGLWASALSWSCQQRTDRIPSHFLAMVGANSDHAEELVAAGFWIVDEGGWVIHAWSEYQEASLTEKRATAGHKGGKRSGQVRSVEANAKQNEANEDLLREANGKQTAKREPSPSQPNPSQPSSKSLARKLAEPDRFDEFWSRYPRRVEKRKAREAWRVRVKAGADPDDLIRGAERYADWVADGGVESPRFIKHPTTWLRAGCENDELEPVASMRGPPQLVGSNAALARVAERMREETG